MRHHRRRGVAGQPANDAFPRLARADARREFMATERPPGVIGPGITGEDDDEKQRQQFGRQFRNRTFDHRQRDDVPAKHCNIKHTKRFHRRRRQDVLEIIPAGIGAGITEKLNEQFHDDQRGERRLLIATDGLGPFAVEAVP